MSETTIAAPSNEHDQAIAEANATAAVAVAATAAEVARAEQDAAVAIAETHAEAARDIGGELSQCQTHLSELTIRLDQLSREHEEHRATLVRLTQPPPEPPPEPPPNPANGPAEEEVEEVAERPEEPPARAERKRAHRWI